MTTGSFWYLGRLGGGGEEIKNKNTIEHQKTDLAKERLARMKQSPGLSLLQALPKGGNVPQISRFLLKLFFTG